MKKKDRVSLHLENNAELGKRLAQAQTKLARLRLDRYTKHSANTREAWGLRKTIAQLKTILRQKETKA